MPKRETEIIGFKLRISEGLRRKIERRAKQNNRSANSECVAILEHAFEERGDDATRVIAMKAAWEAIRLWQDQAQMKEAGLSRHYVPASVATQIERHVASPKSGVVIKEDHEGESVDVDDQKASPAIRSR